MSAQAVSISGGSSQDTGRNPDRCGCDKHTDPCNCRECGECGSERCGLTCNVQPRFFCGQLLNDDDLTALLDWTKNRLRLARYRDGWGVVHGLEVSIDPRDHASVAVSPGYAISCCGDDIVLCDRATLAIGAACGSAGINCEDLIREKAIARLGGGSGQPGRWASAGEPNGSDASQPEFCDLTLSVRYREEQSSPQAVLRGGACHQAGHCEPSRTNERYELFWDSSEADSVETHVRQFCARYSACAGIYSWYVDHYRGPDQLRTLLDLVRSLLDSLPNRHSFIPESLIAILELAADAAELENRLLEGLDWEIERLLVFVIVECRLSYFSQLAACCHMCDGVRGVPLARVQVVRDAMHNWRIFSVNGAHASRRGIRRDDCWPACPGSWNFGRLIWQPVPHACSELRAHGIAVTASEIRAPQRRSSASRSKRLLSPNPNADLRISLEHPPIIGCGTGTDDCCPTWDETSCNREIAVTVSYIDSLIDGPRVVAITPRRSK